MFSRARSSASPTYWWGAIVAFVMAVVLGAPTLALADPPPSNLVPPVTVTIDSLPAGPGRPATFTISSTEPTVTKFRYGWTARTNEVAAIGTTVRSATVTIIVPHYGINTLYVSAVDNNYNEGYSSIDLTVPSPASPTALWSLQAYPGATRAQALHDQSAVLDTPLTGVNIGWADDVRMIGAEAVDFDGQSSYLSASPAALDTSGTFAIAAWVRLSDKSQDRTLVSKDSSGLDSLSFGYRKDINRWSVQMPSKAAAPQIKWAKARSTSIPKLGLWTHLATVYNTADQTLKLYVNGILEGTATNAVGFNDPQGEFRLGRSESTWWQGNLADVLVYDRALSEVDFFGQRASDPYSGGVDASGLLHPLTVGTWDFVGTYCYEQLDEPYSCDELDYSMFGRHLQLTQGTSGASPGNRDGLWLDGVHWIDDPTDPYYGLATKEYGWSQTNIGEDGNPVWQDSPVLRTDQSYSVSVWGTVDPGQGAQTLVSQDSNGFSAFQVAYRPDNGGEWVFKVRANADGPTDTKTTYAVAPAPDPTVWHHLVGVLDATRSQVRLYVDGVLTQTVNLNQAWKPWQASGSLLVGRATTPSGPTEWLHGGLDDLELYQGALSDTAVSTIFDRQSW
ncbi:LamG domain-containing protein [Micromonospora sp. NPDC004704]